MAGILLEECRSCFIPDRNGVLDIIRNVINKKIINTIKEIKTPAYIYDFNIIDEHIEQIKKYLVDSLRAKIFYSIKANPNPFVIKFIERKQIGLEVASFGELNYVLDYLNIDPDKIILVGPAKTEETIKLALNNNIKAIVIESEYEIQYIKKYYNNYSIILIRINIPAHLDRSLESMIGPQSKFGMNIIHIKNILNRLVPHIPIENIGIHFYAGSQILDCKILLDVYKILFSELTKYGFYPNYIDLGGGFGIRYKPEDLDFDFDRYVVGLKMLLSQYNLEHGEIWYEIGRYLVGNAGIFISTIIDIKERQNKFIIITDGGMNAFIRPIFLKEYHPLLFYLKNPSYYNIKRAKICGNLCTPIDCLPYEVNVPDSIDVNDKVVIFKTGAYGLTLSPLFFLYQNLPKEYIIHDNNLIEVKKRYLKYIIDLYEEKKDD